VTITPLTNLTTYCSPEGDLTFDYQVSSVPASNNLMLALADNAGNCSLSRSTGMPAAMFLCAAS
jgi:hypothetical protein